MTSESQHPWAEHIALLLDSFEIHLGRPLIHRSGDPTQDAETIEHAPFVVLSHSAAPDPVLTYGNQIALKLWEMERETLLGTPSRLTAEPMHRDERQQLLERTERDGYVDDYRGIRISHTGRRFMIESAIVWNLVDGLAERVGQAATFDRWDYLPAKRP